MPKGQDIRKLTSLELQALEGELLGDGSLFIGKHYSNACFQVQTAFEGQASFARLSLLRLGGQVRRFSRHNCLAGRRTCVFQVRTERKSALTEQFLRWYPQGWKIVPPDFCLTSGAALHWYIGDGSLKKDNPAIVLCSDGFDELSIRRLLMELRRVGFCPRVHVSGRGHPRIALGAGDVERWLSWIGPCPIPELAHKWMPVFRARRNRRVEAEEKEEILRLFHDGWSYPRIAAHLGRSYYTIYGVVVGRKRKSRA